MAKRPRQQRIESYGEFRPTGVDDSAARRMQALAGLGETVAGVAEQFGRAKADEFATTRAKKAIDEATTIDPETGEVTREKIEMQSGMGWGRDAYNKEIAVHEEAIRQQYLDGIDREAQTNLNRFFDENKNNPDAANTIATEYAKGLVNNVSPEYQGLVSDSLSNAIFKATETLRSNKRAADISFQITQGQEVLQENLDMIAANAFKGENTADAIATYEARVDSLAALSPEQQNQAAGRKNLVRITLKESELAGKLQRIADGEGGIPAAMEELTKFESATSPSWYTEDAKNAFIQKQQTQLNRKKSRSIAANAVATQESKDFVDGVVNQLGLGVEVPSVVLTKARSMAVTPAQKKSLFNAEQSALYATSSSADRQQLLTTALALPETADLAKNMIAINKRIQSALNQDPLAFSISQGVVESVEIDLLNPTAEQLTAAYEQAGIASKFQGVNVPILTDPQVDSLLKAWPELDPTAQAELANAYGPRSFIWGKFADKNQGVYAQGAAHPNSNVRTQIFDGKAALNANATKFGETSTAVFERTFNEMVGSDTLPDQDYRDMLDASISVYASMTGQGTHIASSREFKQAVASVVGNVPTIRNYKTILPYNVTDDELEGYFDNMDVATLQQLSSEEKTPEQLEKDLTLIKQSSRIKAISNDRYVIQPGSGLGIFDGLRPLEFTVNRTVIDGMMSPETEETKEQLSKEYAEGFAAGAPGMARTPRDIPFLPGSSIPRN